LKASGFTLLETVLLKEQSEHFSKANLMIEREQKTLPLGVSKYT
jgi:hypothetical protein